MSDMPDALRRRMKIEAWLVDWFGRECGLVDAKDDDDDDAGCWAVGPDDLPRLADAIEREIEEVMK